MAATSSFSGTLSTPAIVLPVPPLDVVLAPSETLPESSVVSGVLVTYLIRPPTEDAP